MAVVVVVAVEGFIAISQVLHFTQVLHLATAYAALLYFWYWAVIKEARPRAVPASLLGSLLGVGTAALLQLATRSHSPIELVTVLLLIVSAIVTDVMRLAPFVFNACYMLFLTMAAAPPLQAQASLLEVAEAIVLSAVYFGAIVVLLAQHPRVRRRA